MEFTLLLFHSVVICVDKVKTCCSDLVVINAAVLYSFQQMRCRQAVFYHYCINPSHTFLYFYVLEILWSLYYHNNNNSTTMFKPRGKNSVSFVRYSLRQTNIANYTIGSSFQQLTVCKTIYAIHFDGSITKKSCEYTNERKFGLIS